MADRSRWTGIRSKSWVLPWRSYFHQPFLLGKCFRPTSTSQLHHKLYTTGWKLYWTILKTLFKDNERYRGTSETALPKVVTNRSIMVLLVTGTISITALPSVTWMEELYVRNIAEQHHQYTLLKRCKGNVCDPVHKQRRNNECTKIIIQ